MVCFTFTWIFSFWNENAVKASTDRKHESAGQPSQSTCLLPYRNEPVPPLHDTGGTCRQISFWNENLDPMRLPEQSRSGMTRSGIQFWLLSCKQIKILSMEPG